MTYIHFIAEQKRRANEIDLLSFISLYPDSWAAHSYVALCGTSGQAMLWMLEQYPNLLSISLCLDNDEVGIKQRSGSRTGS